MNIKAIRKNKRARKCFTCGGGIPPNSLHYRVFDKHPNQYGVLGHRDICEKCGDLQVRSLAVINELVEE